jgi:hypothetical protein
VGGTCRKSGWATASVEVQRALFPVTKQPAEVKASCERANGGKRREKGEGGREAVEVISARYRDKRTTHAVSSNGNLSTNGKLNKIELVGKRN